MVCWCVPPCGCCEMSNRATVVLMSRTLGAETGIKVVRGRQGEGACGQIGSLPLLGGV